MEAAQQGFTVVAGRLAALTPLLRAAGIPGADAGLGEGDAFAYGTKVKNREPPTGIERSPRLPMGWLYVPQLGRSVSANEWARLIQVSTLRGHLFCRLPCCPFSLPVETTRSAYENTAFTAALRTAGPSRASSTQRSATRSHSSSHDREVRYWNKGAERIFGYDAHEMLGSTLDPIIPERLRQRHIEGFRSAIACGSSRYGDDDLLAVPAHHADGRDGRSMASSSTATKPR